MPRVKRGVNAHKHREKTLKYTKGFCWSGNPRKRAAKEAWLHAWVQRFRGRKEKKRDMRGLWTVKINAAVREDGISYSKFIAMLKKNKIELDRKILADLAEHEPAIFKKIVAKVK